jgi:glycosyltransferase involved in cell wall biosynthesis
MKLIIQIPCFNEEASLPIALADLPKQIPGVDEIEILIIDDGSTDRTIEVAKTHGVHHVARLPKNKGLAAAFSLGIETCLKKGADIIVNTDADNQYCGADISRLVEPILKGRADFVIGSRPIQQIEHFSPIKKVLQRLGSWVVRKASGTHVPDAPSGFRAFSRNAAARMHIFSKYTYTLETIILAGRTGIAIESVPIRTNKDLRPSRLVKSIPSYIYRSIFTIIRIFVVYQPLQFFSMVGGSLFGIGLLFGLRFLIKFALEGGSGHVQSLILASLLMTLGFITVIVGILADLISVNRRLNEKILVHLWLPKEKSSKDISKGSGRHISADLI